MLVIIVRDDITANNFASWVTADIFFGNSHSILVLIAIWEYQKYQVTIVHQSGNFDIYRQFGERIK